MSVINNFIVYFKVIMSSTETEGGSCVSEVTLAISKARGSGAGTIRSLDSPDSDDGSSHSNSFTIQRFNYTDDGQLQCNSEILQGSLPIDDLRIPIVGYEVMEERARFTVSLSFFILCLWLVVNCKKTTHFIDIFY